MKKPFVVTDARFGIKFFKKQSYNLKIKWCPEGVLPLSEQPFRMCAPIGVASEWLLTQSFR